MNIKLNKFIYIFSVVTISIAFLMMGYFFYLFFYPFKTIEFASNSFTTVKTEYRQGEIFTYRVAYQKYLDSPAKVIRSFVNGIVYQLPIVITNNPKGVQDFINASVQIPEELPPGTYHMEMTVIYQVNSFREIIHKVSTNNFQVLSK